MSHNLLSSRSTVRNSMRWLFHMMPMTRRMREHRNGQPQDEQGDGNREDAVGAVFEARPVHRPLSAAWPTPSSG